jgi:hypothetical protein
MPQYLNNLLLVNLTIIGRIRRRIRFLPDEVVRILILINAKTRGF